MGCDGCPLYPSTTQLANEIGAKLAGQSGMPKEKEELRALLKKAFGGQPFSDVYHLREQIAEKVGAELAAGEESERIAGIIEKEISSALRCYAGLLHAQRGLNPLKPEKVPIKGYARRFEEVTLFPGRTADACTWPDLSGNKRLNQPWLDGFPRLIFVSNMGDVLSNGVPFEFVKEEIVDQANSAKGRAHVWLWLTKRPRRMAEFSKWLTGQGGSWPDNLVPMTSVIDRDMAVQVKHLKKIPAKVRGLSVEPLWEEVDIDLDGIDWVIAGGESESEDRPFDLAWARKLRDQCRSEGKAFFMKQFGSIAIDAGQTLPLKHRHGGDWDEWPEDLRIRELPQALHSLTIPRDGRKAVVIPAPSFSRKEVKEFQRLNEIVERGIAAFMEAGEALREIRDRELWKAGGYTSWDNYCLAVLAITRNHANRLIRAAKVGKLLSGVVPIGPTPALPPPRNESQLRPLLNLDDPKRQVEVWARAVEKAGGQPTARQVSEAVADSLSTGEGTEPEKIPPRERRLRIVARLRSAVANRNSWEEVEALVAELEELL